MRNGYATAVAAAIFIFYFFLFEGVGLDYWDTYIAAPATFVAGKPCRFVDAEGRPRFTYHLQGRLPHDLSDPDRYGIVSKDQRIGAGVTFAIPYRVFGTLGFRLGYAAFGVLTFLMGHRLGRRLFGREWQALALGMLVACNPYMLTMDRLNANFVSVPITLGLLALLLDENPRWLIAGLVFGAAGGIRNELIIVAPAVALLILTAPGGRKGLLVFGLGAFGGILPYLAWNRFAFGKAIIHASQYGAFDGFRPSFPHRLLGWEFELNGLFNWPFYTHLVRTPHYPFPTYLTLPLTILLCFGVLLCACAIVGAGAQWRVNRRHAAGLLAWIVLWLGLFLFQENWEEPKNTFGVLAVGPLCVLMVRGLAWLSERPRSAGRWGALAAAALVLELGVHAARRVEVPVDSRWYERFPKAKVEAASVGCLADEQRREWMFFHTDECKEELAFQRRKLTRGNLLPRTYYPLVFHRPDVCRNWGCYAPDIFDIWDRIYGE